MMLTHRQEFEKETGRNDDKDCHISTYIYKHEYIEWLERRIDCLEDDIFERDS